MKQGIIRSRHGTAARSKTYAGYRLKRFKPAISCIVFLNAAAPCCFLLAGNEVFGIFMAQITESAAAAM